MLYPDRCLSCGEEVTARATLCPACWAEAHFISGLACDGCGAPVPGDAPDQGVVHCEACHTDPRPWSRGRAVALYQGPVRRMTMALKHGDRQDLAPHMAKWMARTGADILTPDTLLLPVPLHWSRLLKRRFNQSALLAQRISRLEQVDHVPDLLQRTRATPPQKDMTHDDRFANLRAAIRVRFGADARLKGRTIVLVDDVMTTGATMAACAQACLDGGARQVDTLVFARVARPE